MNIVTIMLLTGAQACGSAEPIQRERPLSELLTLTLSADKVTYYEGEPLQLAITVKNESQTPIRGYFASDLACGLTQILYQRSTNPFTVIRVQSELRAAPERGYHLARNLVIKPSVLAPGEEITLSGVVALDVSTGRLTLDQPGAYRLQAVYREDVNDSRGWLSSEPIDVSVVPARGAIGEARASYSVDLARFAQFAPGHSRVNAGTTRSAIEYLEKYPDAPYSSGLRRALKTVLHSLESERDRAHLEAALLERARAVAR